MLGGTMICGVQSLTRLTLGFPAGPLKSAIRGRLHSVSTTAGLQTYRAAVCTELGKPLQLQDLPRKDLGEKEVRVGIHSAGINFADLLVIQGLYQDRPPLPFVPGFELAGEILELGPGVTHLTVGDRVASPIVLGTFAEETVCSSNLVWKVPDSIDHPAASAVLVCYGTAWMALTRKANVQPGETVLVTAAAGGVGLAAVDLAANVFGAKVIGACGGPEKCALVKEKGAMEAIDYNTDSIKDRVKEITSGRGANIIVDNVGGDVLNQCLRSIAFEGRLLVVGFAGGEIPKIPANLLLLKSSSVTGIFWGSYKDRYRPAFDESVKSVIKCLSQGKINAHISSSFPLSKVNEAFQFIQSRKSTGKVVISTRQ